jgi:hypothetical protein
MHRMCRHPSRPPPKKLISRRSVAIVGASHAHVQHVTLWQHTSLVRFCALLSLPILRLCRCRILRPWRQPRGRRLAPRSRAWLLRLLRLGARMHFLSLRPLPPPRGVVSVSRCLHGVVWHVSLRVACNSFCSFARCASRGHHRLYRRLCSAGRYRRCTCARVLLPEGPKGRPTKCRGHRCPVQACRGQLAHGSRSRRP